MKASFWSFCRHEQYSNENNQLESIDNASSADVVDSKHAGTDSGVAAVDSNTRLVEPANKISDRTNTIHIGWEDVRDQLSWMLHLCF